MIGQTPNQPGSINCEQVPNPGREQVTDAKVTGVGVKRGKFPDGDATVLVLDCFQKLWSTYEQRVPQECNLLFVRDTDMAEQAMRENTAIGVVIAQGLSRKTTNCQVDSIADLTGNNELVLLAWLTQCERAGEPVNDWLDNYEHTLAFLGTLQRQGFGGLVQVVSRTLKSYEQSELLGLKGLRVQYMDKHDFFSGAFTGKVDGLWGRIARYERYERETGRTLSSKVPAGQHFNQLLTQAVYPHPAEDRLFGQWEEEYSRWGSFDKPQVKAVEMAVTDLEEFKLVIQSGDVRAIYAYAAQLPDNGRTCDCVSAYDLCEYQWLHYFHPLHWKLNRAIWEILDMAGLMEWTRLELEFDLASQNPDYPDYGYHIRRDRGEQLREFFQPEEPSERWVDWLASLRR